ncbi:hypothetical protein [Gilliamella sp. CG16]|uniref:hypothetical protein n=1 Tax=Gilliamella sp. CG16 TaxID=3351503 RepID=UPI003985B784
MSDKRDKLVSASELSRQSGVTKQTVSRKIKNRILLPVDYTAGGRPLFDLDSSLKVLAEQQSFDDDKSNQQLLLNKGGRPKSVVVSDDDQLNTNQPSDDVIRFNRARADKAVYQAQLVQIEVAEKLKQVVSVESVKQQGSNLGSVLINSLTNLPDRLSDELATLDNSREIHKLLTSEINAMVIDIRKQLGDLEIE